MNAHGAKYPFMGVVGMDVITAITVVVLSSIGLFGEPEVSERELKIDLLKAENNIIESDSQTDTYD